jgi:hypothetical protein
MDQRLSWETNSHLASQAAFYVTKSFRTVFTTSRHRSPSWATCVQSTPSHPISLKYILILSHLRLGLLPFSAEVKNKWSCSSTPTIRLYAVVFSTGTTLPLSYLTLRFRVISSLLKTRILYAFPIFLCVLHVPPVPSFRLDDPSYEAPHCTICKCY